MPADTSTVQAINGVEMPRYLPGVGEPLDRRTQAARHFRDIADSLFKELTGGRRLPAKAVKELFVVAGRRSGKSRVSALLAVFLAISFNDRAAAGEIPLILVLAQNVKAARICFSYVRGLLASSPMTEVMVASETQTEIWLTNGVEIHVAPANYKGVRGRSLLACIADETSFWWSDELSSNPASEVLLAVRPALITFPNSLLCVISSPYSRQGVMYDAFEQSFGKNDNHTLVVQAASRDLNPLIDQAFVDRQIALDPARGRAEWLGEFRADVSNFLPMDVVLAAVDHDRPLQLPARDGLAYRGHIDSSSGRSDAAALSVGHYEGDVLVIDCLVAKPVPFDPAVALGEFATVLKSYGLRWCTVDRYAPGFVESALRDHGVSAEIADKTTSEIFLEVAPLFMTGAAKLPSDKTLVGELAALERRPGRVGRDTVSHGPGGHDDRAAAVAGCLYALGPRDYPITEAMMAVCDDGSVSAQLLRLREQGITGTEAMLAVEQPTPLWERHRRRNPPYIFIN